MRRSRPSGGFAMILALMVGFTLFSACAFLVQVVVQGVEDTKREAVLLQERAERVSLSGEVP